MEMSLSRHLPTVYYLQTLSECDALSLCFVIVAPVCHFGAAVMGRALVAAFLPLGEGAKDEGPLVLVQLVPSPLQVEAFVSLALDCPVSPFSIGKPSVHG